MMYVRTRYLCACVVVSDAALLGAGVPLQKYSWGLVHTPAADVHSILLALLGNLALLAVLLCGFAAATIVAQRGAFLLVRRYAAAYVRSNSAQRTIRRR
ncbi:MAG TPA: hypothetical protein VFL13_02875 [Candidatus Baltobacteraceae bacterium]|nr:hypothetical protein [Candidatus Baltobacteraceae bacterium]